MATRYVSVTATGGGNGTSGSRWNVSQANQNAVAGDTVLIAPGFYTTPIAPANAGTGDADANRIIFAAENPASKPVFSGASTATTGATAPASVTGWTQTGINLSGGVLTYPSGPNSGNSFPYVWRCNTTFSNVIGVWCNHPTDAVSGVTTTAPTGYFHSLWLMEKFNTDGVWNASPGSRTGANPDMRIHERGGHEGGGNDGSGQYALHDWQSMSRWNAATPTTLNGPLGMPTNSLDVRLHDFSNHNPNNFYMVVGVRDVGFQVIGKQFVTLRNLRFQHFRKCEAVNSSWLTLDGVEIHQCGETAFILGEPSNNVKVINCKIIGGGAWQGHYHNAVASGSSNQGCNNVLFENCEVAYGGHGGWWAFSADGWTVRGCYIHHTGTGFLADRNCANFLIEDNRFHDNGFTEFVNILKAPHPALEIDSMQNAVVRRNEFVRCGIGVRMQAGFNIQGVDVRHNSFIDNQVANIHLNAPYPSLPDGLHDCQYRNNIFYGPSGGDAFYRGNYISGGKAAMVYETQPHSTARSTLNNQTIRRNLWVLTTKDSIVPYAIRGGTGIGNVDTITGATGTTINNVFGSTSQERGPQTSGNDPVSGIFVNKAGGDFHLATGSPAIGTGVAISGEPSTDLGRYPFTGGGGNQAPTATITSISNRTPVVNTAITMNGSGSDPDGTITAFQWDFGDGTTSTTQNPSKTYTSTGLKTVQFRVQDNGGLFSSWTSDTVNVQSNASSNEITLPPTGATASSSQATPIAFPPSQAVNGDDPGLTGWVSASGSPGSQQTLPQWWRMDLGSIYRVDQVKAAFFRWNADPYIHTYDLDTSLDGVQWSNIVTNATSVVSGDGYTVQTFPARDLRYFRYTLRSNNQNSQSAGLNEVKAFGISIPGGDTTLKYVIANSAWSDSDGTPFNAEFGPAKVNDGKIAINGDPFSCWVARLRDGSNNPRPVYLQADLGSSKPVGRVRIAPYRPRNRRYRLNVFTSTDGVNFVNRFPADQVSISDNDWTTLSFTPVNARYVQILFVGEVGGPDQIRCWEIEIYPA